MTDFIVGTSALHNANVDLMRKAGIGWVRTDFPFPFSDRIGGNLTNEYLQARETARAWSAKGLKLMGVTPLGGIGTHQRDPQGQMHMVWKDWLPAWMGTPGSDQYLRQYQEMCAFLAHDLRGVIQMWQIANELDIPQFAGPLNLRQASEMVLLSAQALKSVDNSLLVSTNTAGSQWAYYLYGRLFCDPRCALDYCGVDQYYGSWQDGSPDRWAGRIAELYTITGVKVLVNEWGFSSAGEYMTSEQFRVVQAGAPSCQFKRWMYTWGAGHTPQSQAEYVRIALESFLSQREKLLGFFFYRWEDQATCWQCGAPDCPIETAWGLVDQANHPKPSYVTFIEGVRKLTRE